MNPTGSKEKVDLNLINYKVGEIQSDIKELKDQVRASNENSISRVEFELRVGRLEKLVYGLVALILTAVASAIIYSVVKN